jgi:hypothetical protein
LERLVNELVDIRHESRQHHEESQRTAREVLKRHTKEMGALRSIVRGHGARLSRLETE